MPVSWISIIIDSFVIAGLLCFCALILMFVTQADLGTVLYLAPRDSMTGVSLIVLLVSVINLYLLLARGIFGASLGEWAFDMMLGTPKQQSNPYYPFRILWRAIICTATGFLLFPIISTISRKDYLGQIAGLKLYSEG